MSKTKKSAIFQCMQCPKHFKSRGSLGIHMKCHYPDQFLLQCQDCSFTSFQKSNLAKHLAVIHKKNLEGELIEDTFACSQCDFKSVTEYQLKNHVARKHPSLSRQYRCSECSYTTIEKAALAKHVRIHTQERPYSCEICAFSFSNASGIARHRRSHSKIKPFKCETCEKEFADKKRWREHLMGHETNNCGMTKQYTCPSCKYSTNRTDNLNTHIKRSHVHSNDLIHFSSILSSSPFEQSL